MPRSPCSAVPRPCAPARCVGPCRAAGAAGAGHCCCISIAKHEALIPFIIFVVTKLFCSIIVVVINSFWELLTTQITFTSNGQYRKHDHWPWRSMFTMINGLWTILSHFCNYLSCLTIHKPLWSINTKLWASLDDPPWIWWCLWLLWSIMGAMIQSWE